MIITKDKVNHPLLMQGAPRTLPSPRAVSRRLVPNQGKITLSKKDCTTKESICQEGNSSPTLRKGSFCQKEIKEFLTIMRLSGHSDNTVVGYEGDIKQFFNYSHNLTKSKVNAWIISLYNEQRKSATIQRKLYALKSFAKFLEIEKEVPTINFQTEKLLPKYLKQNEIEIVLSKIKTLRDKAIFNILLCTGLRISELISLDRKDISGNKIKVKGKGNKERIVILSKQAINILKKYLETRIDENPALFLGNKKQRMTRGGCYFLIKHCLEYCNVKGSPHWLRHTFATKLIKSGMSIYTLSKLLGHSSPTITQRYAHLEIMDLEREYMKYWKN